MDLLIFYNFIGLLLEYRLLIYNEYDTYVKAGLIYISNRYCNEYFYIR